MFHAKINSGANVRAIPTGELALRAFFSEHEEPVGDAAVLLAGRRGARLINAIRDGLDQPGRIRRSVQLLLLELRRILFLDHVKDDDWDDMDGAAMLEPDDPVVPEICLVADGLDEALRDAWIVPSLHERST